VQKDKSQAKRAFSLASASLRMFPMQPAAASCSTVSTEPTIWSNICKETFSYSERRLQFALPQLAKISNCDPADQISRALNIVHDLV